MHDQEAIQMMMRCREEIRSLRAQINNLAPKADAYDQMSKVLNLLPRPNQAYGEDLVWRLDKAIEELVPRPEKEEAANEH